MKVKISENNTKTAAMSGVSWEIRDTLGNSFEIYISYGNLERSVGIFPDEVKQTYSYDAAGNMTDKQLYSDRTSLDAESGCDEINLINSLPVLVEWLP